MILARPCDVECVFPFFYVIRIVWAGLFVGTAHSDHNPNTRVTKPVARFQ